MRYNQVCLEAIGYELAPHVVASEDIEEQLAPLFRALHIPNGQLEAWTGIQERRMWDVEHTMHEHAANAGRDALTRAGVSPAQIGMLIYGGVCRDNLEPATACAVAHKLQIPGSAQIFDISNACLGVLNGIVHVANAIELGQIEAGLIVSCESSRQIVESTIAELNNKRDMDAFRTSIATMTGGSGAVGVVLTHSRIARQGHRLLGGIVRNASEHHGLCRWGPDTGIPATRPQVMVTDALGVLKHGVVLGTQTFRDFREELQWGPDRPDKVICHQVGSAHQKQILSTLEIPVERDFTTFEMLGNMGTVSVPLTASIANERGFLQKGDLVGFLGIGSGLNCFMLGFEW